MLSNSVKNYLKCFQKKENKFTRRIIYFNDDNLLIFNQNH